MPPMPVFEASSRPAVQAPLPGQRARKGKEKAAEVIVLDSDEEDGKAAQVGDDRLWVDMYEPQTEEELAVHVKKVKDVRQWLTEAFESDRQRKYRRILALTGPAGTAKTATLRVLSREMQFDILEWRNCTDDVFHETDDYDPDLDTGYEGLSEKFHKFIVRAACCRPLFPSTSASASSSQSMWPAVMTSVVPNQRRQVILLEDLPNVLHPGTQRSFHASLETLVSSSSDNPVPVVIILSSSGVRGENPEDDTGRTWRTKDSIDIRMVIPPSLLGGPYVTQISFNPIAPTLMHRALAALLARHLKSANVVAKPRGKAAAGGSTKEVLDLVVETANGDIRSAIMALQFACTDPSFASALSGRKGTRSSGNPRALMEAITRREQSLALFHLIGKILYSKRKGDAPPASMSKADAEKERALDRKLKDPPALPLHLRDHDRRASRVDVETLYADTPIDSSLLSLYIHQNYTQYCNTLDECGGVAEWMSLVDASGGESIMNTNPTRFHLLALGTMHSLPSPVPRKGQRNYKPEFFDFLRKQREAEAGVSETLHWLRQRETCGGGWTARDVALELPAVLKALDARQASASRQARAGPPPSHRAFSSMRFVWGSGSAAQVADEELDASLLPVEGDDESGTPEDVPEDVKESTLGGWLEDDDIEDV